MRSPDFWSRPPGVLSTLLSPLAMIWSTVTRRRMARDGIAVEIPVICVGNLTAGGTGKTPVVMHLLEHFAALGIDAHALSRGYGGTETGPLRVDPKRHEAAGVGDEPLLLAAFGPAWIARDRAAGAKAIAKAGADLIVMDDGFQNPSLRKDLSIVVIDAAAGFGNGHVIPAGPLREPVMAGLARADLVVLIGEAGSRADFLARHSLPCPVVEAALRPIRTGMDWAGLRVLAFAGIGRPDKFFATLTGLGAEVVSRHSFADHAPYRQDLLARLANEARRLNAQLVSTEKDAVRLPEAFRREVLTLPVRLDLADAAPLEVALDPLIS